MLPIYILCHLERSERSLTSASQGSLWAIRALALECAYALGMTCNCSACTRSRAPREDSRGIAFGSKGPTLNANPREDAFFELSFTARSLNGRVRRRLLASED